MSQTKNKKKRIRKKSEYVTCYMCAGPGKEGEARAKRMMTEDGSRSCDDCDNEGFIKRGSHIHFQQIKVFDHRAASK